MLVLDSVEDIGCRVQLPMPWLLASPFLKFSSAHLCIYGIPFLFVSFFSSNSLATVIIFYILFPLAVVSLIPSLQVMLLNLKMLGFIGGK